MRFDTILFELEGVLAETSALRQETLRDALAAEGLSLGHGALADCCAGLPPRAAAAAAARHAGVRLDDTALDLVALRAGRRFAELSARGLSLVPGARDLVARLAPHARLGVVTRAARADAERVLAMADLEYVVELLVTDDDVVAPKPDPAPYQLALRRLARRRPVDLDAVLALEDGAAGIESATAAGLTCVAVGALPAHQAMRAAGVLPSLDGVTVEALLQAAGGTARGVR
ncbi:MAG TPA: HAD family phosphatase [Gemmatimonadaceae bacterium]|nr:HAD family phosphatase [Gemmatimonadaceae bacterium]